MWGEGGGCSCTTWEAGQEDQELKVILVFIFSFKMSQKNKEPERERERAPWLMAPPAHTEDLSLVSLLKMAPNGLITLALGNPTPSRDHILYMDT